MFEKLTSRERVLALTIVGLIPLVLFFGTFLWIAGKLSEKDGTLSSLQSRKTEAQRKQMQLIRASERQKIYLGESLPPNTDVSVNQYSRWLDRLASNEIKLTDVVVHSVSGQNQAVRFQRDPVYSKTSFSVTGSGTLRQLTAFLYRFHDTKVLHRINSLTITPITTLGPGGARQLTDKLDLSLNVEVISLPQSEVSRDWESETRDAFQQSLKQFEEQIVYRNIFGLPNNPPRFSNVPTERAETGEEGNVRVSATDSDERDELKFELVSSSIEGAELEQREGDRSARLRTPPLPQGAHEFVIRVIDSGLPPKSDEGKVTIRVSDAEPEEVEEPEPPFLHAGQTYIEAITRDDSGERVWIHVRTLGKRYQLTVNESFRLDDQKWTILEIKNPQVVIQCNDEKLVFQKGKNLAEPIKRLSAATTTAKNDGRQE